MSTPPDESTYPSWLGPLLLRDQLPLSDVQRTTMAAFLAEYTLHDSYWIGLWCDPVSQSAAAIFQWDSFWSDGRIPFPSSLVATWPILIIVFPQVAHVSFSDKTGDILLNGIATAETTVLSHTERAQLLEVLITFQAFPDSAAQFSLDDTICRTSISGILGEQLIIVHAPEVQVLCFTHAGERLAIPDIER